MCTYMVKCFITTAMIWRSIRANYFCFTTGTRFNEKKKEIQDEQWHHELPVSEESSKI